MAMKKTTRAKPATAASGKKAPSTVRRSRSPVAKPERPATRVRNVVEIDEPRQRAGESAEAFRLQTAEGPDALAEQMGEEFLENVTGADDAAAEHRNSSTDEEDGGPFIYTTGATEFADGYDDSNPPGSLREPMPTVSSPRPV